MSIISLSDVTKIYRTDTIETTALDSVSLDIDKGEFVSIMGPSGCGKSTLLNVIGLLDRPSAGSVSIDGHNIIGLNDAAMADFRNHNLGFIFQSFHLIPSLSVADNVELPLIYRSGVSASERKRLVSEVIDRVGLSHRRNHRPGQLSGGQRQRVAMARAIVGNPEIILADEPTGNLDSAMSAEVMALLRELNTRDGRTIVMVTHNDDQAKLTDRIINLYDGRRIS